MNVEAAQGCYNLYAAYDLYASLFFINETSKYIFVLRMLIANLSCSRILGNGQNSVYTQAVIL